MAFMIKKKKFKFNVKFEVEELSSVPFRAVVFCKVRLLDGGTFSEVSSREEVSDHKVKWLCKTNFVVKMVANANTGVLEPCMCRVSVRKELKGGKSYQKLGFADINLAEFAGAGITSRRYLLEGYDSKRRQDNSTLKVNIDMALLSGDPLFKVPKSETLTLPVEAACEGDLNADNKGPVPHEDYSEDSLASRGSSGFGSLPRKTRSSLVTGEGGSEQNLKKEVLTEESEEERREVDLAGHSRNSSYASKQSEVSGYSSSLPGGGGGGGHSRQSSSGSITHHRTPSAGSSGGFGSLHKQKKLDAASVLHERRVDSTRVDADELVDELIKNTDLAANDSSEGPGLQLFVTKTGTAALSSQQIRNEAPGEKYEQVVFHNR